MPLDARQARHHALPTTRITKGQITHIAAPKPHRESGIPPMQWTSAPGNACLNVTFTCGCAADHSDVRDGGSAANPRDQGRPATSNGCPLFPCEFYVRRLPRETLAAARTTAHRCSCSSCRCPGCGHVCINPNRHGSRDTRRHTVGQAFQAPSRSGDIAIWPRSMRFPGRGIALRPPIV
jgi:hypothetical protein